MIKLHIRPQPAVRMTQRSKWTKQAKRYLNYKTEVQLLARGYELPAAVYMRFNFKTPKSWSKKKTAELLGKPHQQTPDCDNLQKSILDALASKDQYVHYIVAGKWWSDEDSIIIGDVREFIEDIEMFIENY